MLANLAAVTTLNVSCYLHTPYITTATERLFNALHTLLISSSFCHVTLQSTE